GLDQLLHARNELPVLAESLQPRVVWCRRSESRPEAPGGTTSEVLLRQDLHRPGRRLLEDRRPEKSAGHLEERLEEISRQCGLEGPPAAERRPAPNHHRNRLRSEQARGYRPEGTVGKLAKLNATLCCLLLGNNPTMAAAGGPGSIRFEEIAAKAG